MSFFWFFLLPYNLNLVYNLYVLSKRIVSRIGATHMKRIRVQYFIMLCGLCGLFSLYGCGGGGSISSTISNMTNNTTSQNTGEGGGTSSTTPPRVTYLYQYQDGSDSELRSMNIDGTGDRLLDSAVILGNSTIAESSGTLYYIRGEATFPTSGWELYSAETDGSGTTRITDNAYMEYDIACPENGSVYVSQNRDIGGGEYQGDVFSVSGSSLTAVTNSTTYGILFDVSPNGDYVVYLDSLTASMKLYKYNLSGGTETLLASEDTYISNDFMVSPDGTMILYLSGCDDTISTTCENLHVVNASGATLLEFTDSYFTRPVWAPDSTRFAIAQVETSGYDAYSNVNIYTVSSGAKTTISSSTSEMLFLTDWSTDGTLLLGMTAPVDGADRSHVVLMNSDGSGQTTLKTAPSGEYAGMAMFSQ